MYHFTLHSLSNFSALEKFFNYSTCLTAFLIVLSKIYLHCGADLFSKVQSTVKVNSSPELTINCFKLIKGKL